MRAGLDRSGSEGSLYIVCDVMLCLYVVFLSLLIDTHQQNNFVSTKRNDVRSWIYNLYMSV